MFFSEDFDIDRRMATRWEGRIIRVSSLCGQCVITNSIEIAGCAIDGIVTLFSGVLQTAGSGARLANDAIVDDDKTWQGGQG